MIFFFQAEDGIRDDLVTGVQTCLFRSHTFRKAWPYEESVRVPLLVSKFRSKANGKKDEAPVSLEDLFHMTLAWADGQEWRSEERRVGKECRSRWSANH